jgi:thiol-disulfide isomerase/thioredoxin
VSETPPERPKTWRSRLAGIAKELAIAVLLFAVLSTVIGRLRAPDLPEHAPPFTLQNLAGEQVSLADFRGKTVVLNFWATWCAPCRAEIPMISGFAKDNPHIVVLGVSVDGSREQLAKAAPELGIDYPVLVGDKRVQRAYGATTVPTTVVVDPEGRVTTAHVGVIFQPQLWLATRDAT